MSDKKSHSASGKEYKGCPTKEECILKNPNYRCHMVYGRWYPTKMQLKNEATIKRRQSGQKIGCNTMEEFLQRYPDQRVMKNKRKAKDGSEVIRYYPCGARVNSLQKQNGGDTTHQPIRFTTTTINTDCVAGGCGGGTHPLETPSHAAPDTRAAAAS